MSLARSPVAKGVELTPAEKKKAETLKKVCFITNEILARIFKAHKISPKVLAYSNFADADIIGAMMAEMKGFSFPYSSSIVSITDIVRSNKIRLTTSQEEEFDVSKLTAEERSLHDQMYGTDYSLYEEFFGSSDDNLP